MFFKKISVSIYKFISKFYVLIFSRKKLQFINDVFLSLTLDAKGFKNYGDFKRTGEKKFIRLIKDEINFSLDIGANVGNYTKLILQETSSKVISFEPLPDAYRELEVLKKEFGERLETFNIAISNENKRQELYFGNEKSEKASLMKNLEKLSFVGETNINKISVEVKKLDDLKDILKNEIIDFIKIDTEGYEFEVLDGAKNLLKEHQPKFIQIEFNWHQLLKGQTLYKLSNMIDFSDIFRILPNENGLIQIDPSRPENNIYHLSNYIFIRKDISKNYK
tara:strand:- start:30 stop:863 length:834 start_codon:yes stop_codon:yes gene_type:complete